MSRALSLLLLTSACASGGWEAIDRRTLPSADAYPDADALVLFEKQRITMGLVAGEPTFRRR